MVVDPAQQATVEAMNTSRGVAYGSYAGKATSKHVFEIWLFMIEGVAVV